MKAEGSAIQAEVRSVFGSAASGRLRTDGLVPAIVYGSGEETTPIQFKAQDLEQEFRRHSGMNVMLDVAVGSSKSRKVLVKEVQHHPLTGGIIHVDFQVVSLTETLRIEVPVELTGSPVGVTQAGGLLEQLLRVVEVECLPTDIPDLILADVSALEIGDTLQIRDLVSQGLKYEIVSAPDQAVANVSAPRVVEEEVEEGEEVEEAAGAEPEVITERSSEDEGDA